MASVLVQGVRDTVALSEGAPGYGFHLADRGLKDWYGGSDSKSDVHERPQADGAFGIGVDWASSLAISIKGFYSGSSAADAVAAAERLSALRAGGTKLTVEVTDSLRTTSRVVSLRNVSIPDFGTRSVFEFALDMIAADPLRYGAPVSVSTGPPMSGGGLLFPLGTNPLAYWDFGADGQSGRVSVSNDGTAAVWPTLTATGGMSAGFVATNVSTGATVRFERPIPDDSVVSVNQRTGRASIDGQSDVSGFITQREFFSVPAGATHQIQFSVLGTTSGTPQFGLSYAPAFL